MNKTVIITVGVVLILIVLGVWVYLLLFGTPEDSEEVFTNLGIGGEVTGSGEVTNTTLPSQETTIIDTQTDALRQLTTRPIAGFTFVGTSSDVIRYVERGTGHVFEINLLTGSEERLSGATIPQVVEAVFSENGHGLALVSEDTYTRTIVAGTLPEADGETNIDFISLPTNAFDPTFKTDNKIRYALSTNGGTEGYELDIRDNDPLRLFSIPLSEVVIVWGSEVYAYPKHSPLYQGALYRADSSLKPVTAASYGFVGGSNDQYLFATHIEDGVLRSVARNTDTDESFDLSIPYIPEKCDGSDTTLWCAGTLDSNGVAFLDNWYKGLVQSSDLLWYVDIERGESLLLTDLFSSAGRLVDVDRIVVNTSNTQALFRNKIDNTLWLYDRTVE